jgi:hypothetical protein
MIGSRGFGSLEPQEHPAQIEEEVFAAWIRRQIRKKAAVLTAVKTSAVSSQWGIC